MRTGLALLLLLAARPGQSWRSTRIRVLRTEEDKVRFLNNSKVLRENLFFGMRPILYVSRYSCDCPATADPGPAAANWDLPDFPSDDDPVPELPPPKQQDGGGGGGGQAAAPADESEQEDEEFELLISQSRPEHQVPHDRPFILSFRSKPVQRRARRRKVVRTRP